MSVESEKFAPAAAELEVQLLPRLVEAASVITHDYPHVCAHTYAGETSDHSHSLGIEFKLNDPPDSAASRFSLNVTLEWFELDDMLRMAQAFVAWRPPSYACEYRFIDLPVRYTPELLGGLLTRLDDMFNAARLAINRGRPPYIDMNEREQPMDGATFRRQYVMHSPVAIAMMAHATGKLDFAAVRRIIDSGLSLSDCLHGYSLVGHEDDMPILEMLLVAGADINDENFGEPYIFGVVDSIADCFGSRYGFDTDWSEVGRLIDMGADPYLVGREGRNLLDVAADWGERDSLRAYLRSIGIDLDQPGRRGQPVGKKKKARRRNPPGS